MALEDLIPGVSQAKLIVAGILLAAIAGLGFTLWWQHSTINKLQADAEVYKLNAQTQKENNDTLRENYIVCSNSNKTNNATIESLTAERDDAKLAIDNLARQRRDDERRIGGLNATLDKLRKDPANNGPLAKSLRETIRGIQNGDVQ